MVVHALSPMCPPQLHDEFEVSLGYMKPSLKVEKTSYKRLCAYSRVSAPEAIGGYIAVAVL